MDNQDIKINIDDIRQQYEKHLGKLADELERLNLMDIRKEKIRRIKNVKKT